MVNKSYHHGSLRHSLIVAARELIEEHGIEGFSLRSAARRAGVSSAAPAHHFSNITDLLTEVALAGYDELTDHLSQIGSAENPARELHGLATAYISFAIAHPGLFRLMFREELTNRNDPRWSAASLRALRRISYSSAAYHRITLASQMDAAKYPALIGVWASLHGLAHLAVEGALIDSMAGPVQDISDQFLALLPTILPQLWPDN